MNDHNILQLGLNCDRDLKELLRQLCPISPKWEDLGIELGVQQSLLDKIKSENKGECQAQLREMLKAWLQSGTNETKCTWNDVINALESPTIARSDLAGELKHQQKIGDNNNEIRELLNRYKMSACMVAFNPGLS